MNWKKKKMQNPYSEKPPEAPLNSQVTQNIENDDLIEPFYPIDIVDGKRKVKKQINRKNVKHIGDDIIEFYVTDDGENDSENLQTIDYELNPRPLTKQHDEMKIIWHHEIFFILVVCFSIIQAIQIFILQYSSPGSVIMMVNGWISIFLALLSILAILIRWTFMFKRDLPILLIYAYMVIMFWGFTVVQSTTIPVIIFRQSSENFWDLFISLPLYVRILLISSTITVFIIFISVVVLSILKRFKIAYLIKSEEYQMKEKLRASRHSRHSRLGSKMIGRSTRQRNNNGDFVPHKKRIIRRYLGRQLK